MKSIATVNTNIPTLNDQIDYFSGESLRDYDIVIFDPKFPYVERIHFDGGGSCMTVEGTRTIQTALNHWKSELTEALKAGKTIFVILSEHKIDSGASGSTLDKKQRLYQTFSINNYEALPTRISIRNTKGKQILVADNVYKGLHEVLKELAQYKVILEPLLGKKIFAAKDGAAVGSVIALKDLPGKMILLPHFDFVEYDKSKTNKWLKKSLELSRRFVSQIVAIDDFVRKEGIQTPSPDWINEEDYVLQEQIAIEKNIKKVQGEIQSLEDKKQSLETDLGNVVELKNLLFETGKTLENAVNEALKILGYSSENFSDGVLEFDHVIVSPEGQRFIGECEGKDNSAVNIDKFRQLEENIQSDLQREDVKEPAIGILFGNGYRLTDPDERAEAFTEKCIISAKRGTILIRTPDLYFAARHMKEKNDPEYARACREAILNARGGIVNFPSGTK